MKLDSAVVDKEFTIIDKLGEFNRNVKPLKAKIDEADSKLAEYEKQVDNFLKFFATLRKDTKKMEKQRSYIQTRIQNQKALENGKKTH